MVGQIRNLCLSFLFAAFALFGCQLAERRPYQGDPLLAYKRPVTDLPRVEENSILLAFAEPKRPNLPEGAALVDAGKHAGQTKAIAAAPTDSRPVYSAQERSKTEGPTLDPRLEVFLTSRRKVSGVHGHANDYSWLQGTLERDSRGAMALVYLAPGQADAFAGRAHLLNDDRLSAFRVGDVILVEGKPVNLATAAGKQSGVALSYQIRQIWLVRQAD
jgi:hypothetical protein